MAGGVYRLDVGPQSGVLRKRQLEESDGDSQDSLYVTPCTAWLLADHAVIVAVVHVRVGGMV